MSPATERASLRRCGAATVLVLAVASACSTYNVNFPRPESHASRVRPTTELGALFERAAAEHPGESGINYIRSARVALEGRLAMVDLAEQSLDLQYYIWDADISGGLLGGWFGRRSAAFACAFCSTTSAWSIATHRASRGSVGKGPRTNV